MRVRHFVKTLNNTEIGKGGTHEYYVLVSKKVSGIKNFFENDDIPLSFFNLKNGGVVKSIHITDGNEFRINGLGDFYRINNVNAGDEIIFERIDDSEGTKFYLNVFTKNKSVIFQKNRLGFEVLNKERLQARSNNSILVIEAKYSNEIGQLKVEFLKSQKKRADSPFETDFYSIKFNDKDLVSDIKNNEYFELTESNEIEKVVAWKYYEFNY